MTGNIDTNLYSRQIGAFGLETMGKLITMKILISGLGGVGVETAKNLILAGPKSVTLHDDKIVSATDLGANFYLQENQIGKVTRAEGCVEKLNELNEYVQVTTIAGPLSEKVLSEFNLVILLQGTEAELIRCNEFCRSQSPPIGCIFADAFGLAARVFVDFGPHFSVHDPNGEEPKEALIESITPEGILYIAAEKNSSIQSDDYVVFREIEGMTQLNDQPPRQVKYHSKNAFSIGDVSQYSPYIRNGIVRQAKMPTSLSFGSYAASRTHPVHPSLGSLLITDYGKFGNAEQLHILFSAIRDFQSTHHRLPALRDDQDYHQVLQIAQNILQSFSSLPSESPKHGKDKDDKWIGQTISVESINADLTRYLTYFCTLSLSPLASILGGIIAQEAVKFTGKFTPILQYLYLDFFEFLSPASPLLTLPVPAAANRYYDLVALFGPKLLTHLSQLHLFLVGAGALGCEYLKALALLGVATDSKGLLTVTDMDTIELSNLNRQFLFRRQHVGLSKSLSAAQAVTQMNPHVHINSSITRVGKDTEEVFNDAFWDQQGIIVNALDNIDARLYVDSKCVWHGKPLLESGTLGCKANSQVVVPFLTQSYGDSRDPPEESIPVCTLRNFPYNIDHCIEWGKDVFSGLFENVSQELREFLEDSEGYLRRGEKGEKTERGEEKRERLERLLEGLEGLRGEGCVEKAVERAIKFFQKRFYDGIRHLIELFPEGHLTSEGQLFWSGSKRFPLAVSFDAGKKEHLDFVYAMTNILLFMGGERERTREEIAAVARKTKVPEYVSKKIIVKVDEEEEEKGDKKAEEQEEREEREREEREEREEYEKLVQQIRHYSKQELESFRKKLQLVEFEKDQDDNHHIDFITACSNLRAQNYRIDPVDRNKCKLIAGKIIPAVATTTAMITGFVMMEFLKIQYFSLCPPPVAPSTASPLAPTPSPIPLEILRNSFINLALPVFILSEPLPPLRTYDTECDPVFFTPIKAIPNGYSSWDKIQVHIHNGTMKDLFSYLEEKYGINVEVLSFGSFCLFSRYDNSGSHNSRLTIPLHQLCQQISKQEIHKKYLELEVSASTVADGVDVNMPTVKFNFTA